MSFNLINLTSLLNIFINIAREWKRQNPIALRILGNPLRIIALCIVLIYGLSFLTFFNIKSFPPLALALILGFIIVYPFTVLRVFYILVTKHHTKLYAPIDFPRPEDFLACIYGDQSRALTKAEFISTDIEESIDLDELINEIDKITVSENVDVSQNEAPEKKRGEEK